MINLKDVFNKKKETENVIMKSVFISKKHKKFIDDNDINFSKLVRSTIEELMKNKK